MQIHVNNTGENRLFLSIIHILKLLYAVYISAILLAFPSDMSRNSTTLEALLLVLICLLLLCAQRGQSKKYMRCELTRVMVQNYKFQKTLMSNCELNIYQTFSICHITPFFLLRDLPGGARERAGHQQGYQAREQ